MEKKEKKSRGNRSPLRRWEKGTSGNPGGLKKGVVAKRELKKWTQANIAETYNELIDLDLPELREISRSDTLPAIKVIVAGALLRDRLEGELDNTERILERIMGKVVQRTELGGPGGTPLIPSAINFVPVSPGTIAPTLEEKVTPEFVPVSTEEKAE